MNSCILMVEIVQAPQLRYTPDQTPLAEMLVQFPALRAEDPPATLKVVGWGNLAQEIQQQYHQGDRVILEGRLNMNTVERPEGFKEKRAELTLSKIYPLGEGSGTGVGNVITPSPEQAPPRPVATMTQTRSSTPSPSYTGASSQSSHTPANPVGAVPQYDDPEPPLPQTMPPQMPAYPIPTTEADVDDIPF
jgi:single-stranded DNA-binding protein